MERPAVTWEYLTEATYDSFDLLPPDAPVHRRMNHKERMASLKLRERYVSNQRIPASDLSQTTFADVLAARGAEGWELVHASVHPGEQYEPDYWRLIYKRPASPPPAPPPPPAEPAKVTCPGCGRRYRVPSGSEGRSLNCPACRTKVIDHG